METDKVKTTSMERENRALSGWPMLALNLVLLIGAMVLFIHTVVQAAGVERQFHLARFLTAILLEVLAIILLTGHFTLQPNEARVLLLFGAYKGTVRTSGFWWANPFYSRSRAGSGMNLQQALAAQKAAQGGTVPTVVPPSKSTKVSLRARTMNGDRLKVNDKGGNPIEIAAIVIWRVEDTAKAVFDVEDYESYVRIQAESALRHLASAYAYDHGEENEPTLRSSVDEVSERLKQELQERLMKAGVTVEEARLTHLAYAPEIAQVMLRRQQAEAVIAARQKIVHGAVSMVEMALRELSEKDVVKLDEERKAAMVSNLLVVLCGESEATPVINTGTLYN